ncbi:glycosyltransferase [Vibrio cortegadensis]|uniref:glycosyltransferase n=1 Tax=Vibrio cortegadensis TaxID=1328770 RepID=UPI0021C34A2A|nr:glycosyltransferase [Vibrio cortegadensis]MDN3698357.1 glycosyltransferase [Vibrio cortegadensis]
MLKIAYITEKKLDSLDVSGGTLKDSRLLTILRAIGDVSIFYNDISTPKKYSYILNASLTNDALYSEIDESNFDIVVVSAMMNSSFLLGYMKIKTAKIIYLADSVFHEDQQFISVKTSLLIKYLKRREKKLLQNEFCAYLGGDEVASLPTNLQASALQFPFSIEQNDFLFNKDGHFIVVGKYDYKPNLEMLLNINRLAPRINGEIHVYGQSIPKLLFAPNVVVKGFAPSLVDVYRGAKALLYAVDYGIGIKNKVIEAMSFGVPTIGYKEAFTNIALTHKETCVVITSEEGLVDGINNVDFSSLAKKLHQLCMREFSQEEIVKKVETELKRVIKHNGK